MADKTITLQPYQEKFFYSEKRFPALISAIATGKTYMLLLKVMTFCKKYPGSLALIVRKEYTDLRDSTMKDYERYFHRTPNSMKEDTLENGSVIMFRHGAEMNVLKNINLSLFAIEQAEEFDTDEQFVMLRDRLRREGSPYRQGIIIANANGHNWVWKKWVNNVMSDEYDATIATTFDNLSNLPDDFIKDLRAMEIEAPNHYRQYVMNSFEDFEADDLLFNQIALEDATRIEFGPVGLPRRVMAVDVARFGQDKTCYCVIESRGNFKWEQTYLETTSHKDLMDTTGKILDMKKTFGIDAIVIDDSGLGGGVTDRLNELRANVFAFNGAEKSLDELCLNRRAEAYFKLKDFINRKWLKIESNQTLVDQMMTVKFKYKSDGKRQILSKDEMRKQGIKSPDHADALMMAVYYCDYVQPTGFGGMEQSNGLPQYAITE